MNTHTLLIIVVVAAVTVLTRFLPFWVFPEGKEPPEIVTYLSNLLPVAVMGMLIVYCLKSVTLSAYPYGLPEAIGIIVVAGLYFYKRNTLISIIAGTGCYMILVQFVFV